MLSKHSKRYTNFTILLAFLTKLKKTLKISNNCDDDH